MARKRGSKGSIITPIHAPHASLTTTGRGSMQSSKRSKAMYPAKGRRI